MPDPDYNPYNFVPLGEKPVEREPHPGLHCLSKESWSGRLDCTLEVLDRLFTADQIHPERPKDPPGPGNKQFRFLHNAHGTPILQATSLKGMVRAVFEARTNSCLPLASTQGSYRQGQRQFAYQYALLGDHDKQNCSDPRKLCPACRLFGVTHGDSVHAQGRVFFSDAELAEGKLVKGRINLSVLSSPKPHHYQIYSARRTNGGPIAGRKFYYHHEAEEGRPVLAAQANAITEYADASCRFSFKVRFQGLSEQELADLLASLVLDKEHAHKLGMAKPLGFGSCRIQIDPTTSKADKGSARYKEWAASPAVLDPMALTAKAEPLPPALEKLLRRSFHDGHSIGYLGHRGYAGMGIDADGKFENVHGGRGTPASGGPASGGSGAPAAAASLGEIAQKSAPAPAPTAEIRVNQKIKVEVLEQSPEGYRLKVLDTGQDDLYFTGHVVWKVGLRLKVRVVKLSAGKVTKIAP